MALTALNRARMYEKAMVSLMENEPTLTIPVAHMAGFVVEIGLKAYLLRAGFSEDEVKKLGHDLKKLRKAARNAGLDLSIDPPSWLPTLSGLHGSMILRYPHRTITGIVIPGQAKLQREIAELLSAVEVGISKLNSH